MKRQCVLEALMVSGLLWLVLAVSDSSEAWELGRPRSSWPPPHSRLAQGPGATSQANVDAARAVVEEYWASEPRLRYSLLSRTYKERLRRLRIADASEYARAEREPERVWGKRTYQSVKEVGPGAARITLLVEWEQEGYQGVMTFIFDLIMETASWKIENIMH